MSAIYGRGVRLGGAPGECHKTQRKRAKRAPIRPRCDSCPHCYTDRLDDPEERLWRGVSTLAETYCRHGKRAQSGQRNYTPLIGLHFSQPRSKGALMRGCNVFRLHNSCQVHAKFMPSQIQFNYNSNEPALTQMPTQTANRFPKKSHF